MTVITLIIAVLSSVLPLEPVTVRLENAALLTCEFVQTDIWALTLEEETSSGVLYLAPPNLFLFEYSDPPGKKMGFDGEHLYSLDPFFRQVILYRGGEPGSFLHMLERCSDTTLVGSFDMLGDSMIVSLSGDLGEGISSMTVGYSISDSLPWLFRTTDVNNNIVSYTMQDMQVMREVPPDLFTMTVPEDFELIDSGEF